MAGRGEWVDEFHYAFDPAKEMNDAFVELIEEMDGPIDYRGTYMSRAGKRKAGRLLDGVTWDQFPASEWMEAEK